MRWQNTQETVKYTKIVQRKVNISVTTMPKKLGKFIMTPNCSLTFNRASEITKWTPERGLQCPFVSYCARLPFLF